MQEKCGIKNHVFIRHVSNRWLTLEDVTDRLLEQHPALVHYFLSSSLITDKERQNNDRIRKLVKLMGNTTLVTEMHFLKSVMPLFTRITRMFQSEAPLIHILFDELSTLVSTLLRRFVKEKVVGNKSGMQLYQIDYQDSSNHLAMPYIGHDTLHSLNSLKQEGKITERVYKEFLQRAKSFYMETVGALLKTLPLKNCILRDLQVLHPLSRHANWSVDAIKRLAVAIKLFPREKIDPCVDEWKLYRTECLSEEWDHLTTLPGPEDEVEDENDDEVGEQQSGGKEKDICSFWVYVFSIKTPNGLLKYPNLTVLVKLCLTLSHGNADVERSFSENKLLVTPSRTSLNDATINGYRATSSFMRKYGGDPSKLPINSAVLKAVRNARSLYMQRIELQKQAKRKLEESCTVESNAKKRKNDGSEQRKVISDADNLSKEGMDMLNDAIKKKDFNKVTAANAVLERARQMKTTAEEELKKLLIESRKNKK